VYKETKGRIPEMDEELVIVSPNYAATSSKRLFITPNIFNKNAIRLTNDKPRKYDIDLGFPFRDIYTVNITIPDGYTLESQPQNNTLNSKFGMYKVSYTVIANMVQLIRIKERTVNLFPAKAYEELAKFLKTIFKADRPRVVFVRKK
jgi:hypothetical protein